MEIPKLKNFVVMKELSLKNLIHKRERSANDHKSSQGPMTRLSFVNETIDQRNVSQTFRQENSRERAPLPLSAILASSDIHTISFSIFVRKISDVIETE